MVILKTMNFSELKEKLLTSEEFVVSELQKIQVLYVLKKEIRYDKERRSEADTESVAEHIYGMQCLIDYFLPLEDESGKWNRELIKNMAIYHDIDEILTGDTVSYWKTAEDVKNEQEAYATVIERLPESIQLHIEEVTNEYRAQTSPEAKFVKAIDKIEPVFELYSEEGKKTLHTLKTTPEQHLSVKAQYVEPFPVINRFNTVMHNRFLAEGYYHAGA